MITKTDWAIIALVLAFSAVTAFECGFSGNEPKTVVIEVDGQVYAEYETDKIKGEKIVDVYGKNTVRITNEYAEVIYADCLDKRDVKQGKITKPGQIIVCLPNKMTVTIKDKREYDDISR